MTGFAGNVKNDYNRGQVAEYKRIQESNETNDEDRIFGNIAFFVLAFCSLAFLHHNNLPL